MSEALVISSDPTFQSGGLPRPYLIFLGDVAQRSIAKTAFGVRDWAPEACVGQWRTSPAAVDVGLPDIAPDEAQRRGARSMLLGAAPPGGGLSESWIASIVQALDAGLDIVSGLHGRLWDIDAIAEAARRNGRTLFDIRHSGRAFPVASGRRRSGKRLLTVGTDCALGKKYAALALTKALQARGVAADFRATGQTGIMISGAGIAIDAVVADFIAGAAETLSPEAAPDHWDVIEGQGALFHPAYGGVTLGLLHGSQPDALVLCHDPLRTETSFFPGFPLPSVEAAMEAYLPHARRTNPSARFVGVSLNTSQMELDEAIAVAEAHERRTGLPVFDPLRFGMDPVVDRILECG